MTPKISVIMPVYNCAEYLQEAINSMLDQTFDDIEIICVEDGSPDESREVLQRLAKKHKKVRAYYHEENKGISAALNTAIAHAIAPLLARMDGDDICDPQRLQDQYDYLQKNPEIDVVATDLYYLSEDGEKIGERTYDISNFSDYIKIRSPIAHASVVARKEAVTSAGGYDPAFDGAEDYDLWIRMHLQGSRFGHIPEQYYGYRLQQKATKFARTKKQIRNTIRVKKHAKEAYGFRLGLKGTVWMTLEKMLLLLPQKAIIGLFKVMELR